MIKKNETLDKAQNGNDFIADVSSRLISEAILNDKQLQALHAERAKIYSLATPTVELKENGDTETVWIDETNHPNLSKINEMIEHRTEQIKSFYS
jgi:hypothetical protein